MKVSCILACAGSGTRCNLGYNKLLYKINNKTILEYTLEKFIDVAEISEIIVSCSTDDYTTIKSICDNMFTNIVIKVTRGGNTRSLSIKNCLAIVDDSSDVVIIHDGARPYIQYNDILAVIDSAYKHNACILGSNLTDTIKQQDGDNLVNIKRENYILASTPQGFSRELIQKAYQLVDYKSSFTDDSEVYIQFISPKIKVIQTSNINTKITTEKDIMEFQEYILSKTPNSQFATTKGSDTQVGVGYDVHQLVEDRELILGGIKIPYIKGLLGHSDADVVIHALMDSLLSAMGEKDIGHFFPDTDASFKNIDSTILLAKVMTIVKQKKLRVGNISITIMCQAPRLAPYIDIIREKISTLIEIPITKVAIGATTTEGLGIIGEGKGIACYCGATLLGTK